MQQVVSADYSSIPFDVMPSGWDFVILEWNLHVEVIHVIKFFFLINFKFQFWVIHRTKAIQGLWRWEINYHTCYDCLCRLKPFMAVILLCVGLGGTHFFKSSNIGPANEQLCPGYLFVCCGYCFHCPLCHFFWTSLSLSQPTFSSIYLSLERLNMLKSTENFWTGIGGLRWLFLSSQR